jgi:hypothetical protein
MTSLCGLVKSSAGEGDDVADPNRRMPNLVVGDGEDGVNADPYENVYASNKGRKESRMAVASLSVKKLK